MLQLLVMLMLQQWVEDAMAICRTMGFPDLFVTFACNPSWSEIQQKVARIPNQRTEDRPDILARMFQIKMKQLMRDMKKEKFFGTIIAEVTNPLELWENHWVDLTDDLQNRVRRLTGDGNDTGYLQERAILAPKHDDVDEINNIMLSMLPGEMRIYNRADKLCPPEPESNDQDMHPPELLHSLNLPGLPNHCLKLKVGTPIMLLRNVNLSLGLCNGTRLVVRMANQTIFENRVINNAMDLTNALMYEERNVYPLWIEFEQGQMMANSIVREHILDKEKQFHNLKKKGFKPHIVILVKAIVKNLPPTWPKSKVFASLKEKFPDLRELGAMLEEIENEMICLQALEEVEKQLNHQEEKHDQEDKKKQDQEDRHEKHQQKDFTLEQDHVRPVNGWKPNYAATRAIVNLNGGFF
ncbi:hypothetical protein Vadar_014961 [Vaccinium darrowii]|uniref:Uncharacterized protein n=1 Tax=Vaccinium darrowii TaxID=229202 RepID=A0ACB7XZ52_9ERIC|nr:hypothetical protein Vadar_014961 [Vaccinium darrowii]